MRPLSDRVAVVTGASGGIGQAIALALADRGCALCIVGRRREALDSLADRARRSSPAVRVCRADLTVDAEIETLAEGLGREGGGVDVLVHCAGVIARGRLAEASVDDLDRQYRANLRAPYLLTQALLPTLRERRGDVVFVNSSVFLNARAEMGQYAATKYALAAVADSLRDEVNAEGVRVLSVFPGRTATPLQAGLHDAVAEPYRPERLLQPDDVAATVIGALELPRTAEVTHLHVRPFLK